MIVLLSGALILAIGALEKYVGAGELGSMLWRLPGYEMIRENPGGAGIAGAVLIIGALVIPTGGLGVNDKR